MKYKVVVIRGFNDLTLLDENGNATPRKIGDTILVDKDRFNLLYENNKVELIEIKKGGKDERTTKKI